MVFSLVVLLSIVSWALLSILVALTVGAAAKERDRGLTSAGKASRVAPPAGPSTRLAS